jgi:hypothetical protein
MPAVLSTQQQQQSGATVTHSSSAAAWPRSLHASFASSSYLWSSSSISSSMTHWSDFLSALARLLLLTSSTVIFAGNALDTVGGNSLTTATVPSYTSSSSLTPTYQSLRTHDNAVGSSRHPPPQPHSINQSSKYNNGSSSNSSNGRGIMTSPSPPALNESSSVVIGNLTTTDSALNSNLVDCNDFTEQKLLNIVICSISDVNSNIINGTSAENSTFNDTFKNISDDLIRFYNTNNSFFNGTEVSGNDTSPTGFEAIDFESTVYFIQVITTAVVLGIIILATVIGE